VCLWKNIRNVLGNFSNCVSFKVGEGSCIRHFGIMCGAEQLLLSLHSLNFI
jgi:hypothetical protein